MSFVKPNFLTRTISTMLINFVAWLNYADSVGVVFSRETDAWKKDRHMVGEEEVVASVWSFGRGPMAEWLLSHLEEDFQGKDDGSLDEKPRAF